LNLFGKGQSSIIHVNVQKQSGIKDCGLFAIAMSTALLFNIDVTAVYFHQLEMRQHLHACFKTGLMSPFPSSANPK
jgi:Ulp1 family protease